MFDYTVVIEASNEPGDTWQALAPAETVTLTYRSAVNVASWVASHQTVATGDHWRVSVWPGRDADTETPPTIRLYAKSAQI